MAYWLVKSEPATWSWQDHVKAGTTEWDGIRNYQASNNLKAMKKGDRALMYHSIQGKAVVGILEVVKTYYPDPSDKSERFGMVDFKALEPMKTPIELKQIKEDPRLEHLALIRQSRLSVMPIDAKAWRIICKAGGVKP